MKSGGGALVSSTVVSVEGLASGVFNVSDREALSGAEDASTRSVSVDSTSSVPLFDDCVDRVLSLQLIIMIRASATIGRNRVGITSAP